MKISILIWLSCFMLSAKSVWALDLYTDHVGYTVTGGIKVPVTQKLTLGLWAGGYFDRHLVQVIDYSSFNGSRIYYKEKGFSGLDYAPSAELKLGTFNKMTFTGVADLVLRSFDIDSIDYDSGSVHKEVIPRAGIMVSVPLFMGFNAGFLNLFERSMMTKPYQASFKRWRTNLKVYHEGFTVVNIGPYLHYEGYELKDFPASHMSEIGFGFKVEPVQGLEITLGDRFQWKPFLRNSPGHLITLDIFYIFDFLGIRQ